MEERRSQHQASSKATPDTESQNHIPLQVKMTMKTETTIDLWIREVNSHFNLAKIKEDQSGDIAILARRTSKGLLLGKAATTIGQ
jgi:hypothetical protein